MRACSHLGNLHAAAQYRLKRLERLYQDILLLPSDFRGSRIPYVVIELDNLNLNVFREFLISTIRCAKTISGMKVCVNKKLSLEEEICAYVLSITNTVKFKNMKCPRAIRRIDEQPIRDPNQLLNVLADCQASNLASLNNALALNLNVFRDIKFFRHFYAHRNKDTAQKVIRNASNMGILNVHNPDDILQHIVIGRPHSVLEEWLMDASLFYEIMMQ